MRRRLCIVQPCLAATTETFLAAHAERLPADITNVSLDGGVFHVQGRPVLSQTILSRGFRKAERVVRQKSWYWENSKALLAIFRQNGPDAVLAQYGPTAVLVTEACQLASVPLIVHFHGYDASKHEVLRENRENYRLLFRQADAIVAVSQAMRRKLAKLGAPDHILVCNPYGVDCHRFKGGSPGTNPSLFVAVGRFVEKKAPHLLLLAFARVHVQFPHARLRMIGDGPLLRICHDLATGLGLGDAVEFLGCQPHDVVQSELCNARAFVQHSIEASNGDCEGTPVAVLEAGASGLPVIATRHAGIPDVVVEEETGLLVEERDVEGMAKNMLRLAHDADLANRLGQAARQRVELLFSMESSIDRLWSIILACIERRALPSTDQPALTEHAMSSHS